jgi:hypothetical protein
VIPPYPSSTILSLLLPDELAEAAETYLFAVTLFLHLNRDEFILASDTKSPCGSQMVDFLHTYIQQRLLNNTVSLSTSTLDSKVFNLIFRFVSEGRDISSWIDWRFVLGLTCIWYDSRTTELSALITRLHRRARAKMVEELETLRDAYITSLESIILDEESNIAPTLTGLRYLVTLSTEILDLLVDGDGRFLAILHDAYDVYGAHLDDLEKRAILYLFYTIIASLAFRAAESSTGQNKKGKATAGSAETQFFQLFDNLLGMYARGGQVDIFIQDLNRETPFVEIMREWIEGWKGADEAVENLTLYLGRLTVEERPVSRDDAEQMSQKSVFPSFWGGELILGIGVAEDFVDFTSRGYLTSSWRGIRRGLFDCV